MVEGFAYTCQFYLHYSYMWSFQLHVKNPCQHIHHINKFISCRYVKRMLLKTLIMELSDKKNGTLFFYN